MSRPRMPYFSFGEHDDRAAFRRFVGERGELRSVRKFLFAHAGQRNKFRGLAVAEGDCPSLVEKQRVDVASSFNRASRHGENIKSHQAVHPAIPIADKSAPIVVGIRVTKSATSTTTLTLPPA